MKLLLLSQEQYIKLIQSFEKTTSGLCFSTGTQPPTKTHTSPVPFNLFWNCNHATIYV